MRNLFFIFLTIYLIISPVVSNLPCKFIDTVNITSGFKDKHENYVFGSDIYPPGTYQEIDYVEHHQEEKISVISHIRGCICMIKPCIRLCCDKNEEIIPHCHSSDIITVKNQNDNDEHVDVTGEKFGVLFGRPCEFLYELDPDDEEDKWTLFGNGSLITVDGVIRNTDDYCFGISDRSMAVAYSCFLEEDNYANKVYPIGMLISVPFLILTFLIYAFIPELRNLHGKCLMCYIFGLTILYTSLIIAHVNTSLSYVCIIIGNFIYLGVFLSFFWMNVMCYDLWSIVSNGISNRPFKNENHKFLIYCTYAFGCPILMTMTVLLLDHYEPFESSYLPLIGFEKCWIQKIFMAEAIYVYIPISIIILTNIFLFMDTARKIWKAQSVSMEKDVNNKKRIIRRRYMIYIRLFILMGLMWCMETISWMNQNQMKFFYITDFFNCIQGFLIFLICICDVRTRNLIMKKCCPSRISRNDESAATYDVECETTNTIKMSERN